MIGGVNFQPGGGQGDPTQPQQRNAGQGVQEAIRVLSLRLPKVVGAQAAVPHALLTGAGSGGNRVDSVVNQILARIMPTGQPQGTPMPHMGQPQQGQAPQGAPSFSGSAQPNYTAPPPMPSWPWSGGMPNVVIGDPPTTGTDAALSGGGLTPPSGSPFPDNPGMIGTLPPNWEELLKSLGGGSGGGVAPPPREDEYRF
jgi:hypothetical protein